jgi:hypothetical protein
VARRIRVPQDGGEIVLTFGGDPDTTRTWRVRDGHVTAANLTEQRLLLLHVTGSKLAAGTPAGEETEPSPPAAEPVTGPETAPVEE